MKPSGESPLLLPANEHKQLVVIDFEYASANVPGLEFANHFVSDPNPPVYFGPNLDRVDRVVLQLPRPGKAVRIEHRTLSHTGGATQIH